MSAYKEKQIAEKRIAELEIKIDNLKAELGDTYEELQFAKDRLMEAERDVKWEAANDR